jgi:hypothetical protein
MSSSTKSEVSHDPREIEPRQRRSSRLNRKYPGSHSRKSCTSTEAKISKIVKSTSSTEIDKLETLYSPNKGSPKFIKSHEDSKTVTIKEPQTVLKYLETMMKVIMDKLVLVIYLIPVSWRLI